MQAVILAGGKGTRLKPYTLSFPKPLVPVGDYPILEIIIRQLVRSGFDDIVISTGHLAELIEAFFQDGKKWGARIRYVREDKPLNTAGALKLIDRLRDNFLVLNGDILSTLDYSELYRLHLEKKAAATIATKVRETKIDFGVVHISDDGLMTGFTEKPSYSFSVSMGANVLSKRAIELIREGEAIGMPDLLLRLKEAGLPVHCHQSDRYWLDIGRVNDYERAQDEFNSRKSDFLPEE